MKIVARAPGRVNLIGDHTDYTGGLVLPMAIDLATTVTVERGGDAVRLRSRLDPEPAVVPLDVEDPAAIRPAWARYVAGVVALVRPPVGAIGTVAGDLPVGAGLSSSAALEVAVALALGFAGSPIELARLCQAAEQRASGVPCGIMDQLACVAGVAGHALLIDCAQESVTPVPLPSHAAVHIVDTGERRALASSGYAQRRAECEAAQVLIGPLADAEETAVATIEDDVVRRRARHVVTENTRVRETAAALQAGDLAAAGAAMVRSHASLRDDFEVSTTALDEAVERISRLPGVHGVRLTGAGFGGAVVVLADAGAEVPGLRVNAAVGATVSSSP